MKIVLCRKICPSVLGLIALVFFGAFLQAGCNNGENPVKRIPVLVTGITINPEITIAVGDTVSLSPEIQPENATNKNVRWVSGNKNVVSVNANGAINAVAAGTTAILVTTVDGNYAASCEVTVKPAPVSIAITKEPDKTIYLIGEKLDITGMELTVTYDNDTTEIIPVNNAYVGGFNSDTTGFNTITITYGGKITSCTLTIVELYAISVTKQPDKTHYFTGESMNITGLEVTAFYSSDIEQTVPLSDIIVSGFNSITTGLKTITVIYNGKIDTFDVLVTDPNLNLTGMEITTPPAKTVYYQCDNLDLTGMVVTAKWGEVSEILPHSMLEILGFDTETTGTKTIYIVFSGLTRSFTVTVNKLILDNLIIAAEPLKKEYYLGEELDLRGLIIGAIYNSKKTVEVDLNDPDLTIEGFDNISAGIKDLVISYTNQYGSKTAESVIKLYMNALIVTFNKNLGSTEASPNEIAITRLGDAVNELPLEPTRNGYFFAGWNTQANGNGMIFTETTSITSNITLYAQWAFLVTYNLNNGTGENENIKQMVTPGTTAVKPENPSFKYHVFDDWYTEENTKWDFNTVITGHIVLYAQWIFILTSINEINDYLIESDEGSITDPVYLPVQIDLGDLSLEGSGWSNLLYALHSMGKFVNLDLSACFMNGTEFTSNEMNYYGKDRITELSLPNSAISIGSGAFMNFMNLKMIGLPSQIKSIPDYAFYACEKLALTELPAGITYIGARAFEQCTSLALAELPAGISYIGESAFSDCSSLALTSLPVGITSIGNSVFFNCTNLALTELPSGLTTIGKQAFDLCKELALTSLPQGLISIGNYAFYDCTKLALTELPQGLSLIGEYAFYNCTNLTLTSLPQLTHINNSTFYNCKNITLTILPGTITTIGDNAFNGCSSIGEKIIIPASVTYIGSYAFYECNLLNNIFFLSTIPPSLGPNALSRSFKEYHIFVPDGYYDAYFYAPGWDYYYIVEQ